jgi:hypothetical protein
VGVKSVDGKGLREGWDSKELWKSVEKSKAPPFAKRERWATLNSNAGDLAATRLRSESLRGDIWEYTTRNA